MFIDAGSHQNFFEFDDELERPADKTTSYSNKQELDTCLLVDSIYQRITLVSLILRTGHWPSIPHANIAPTWCFLFDRRGRVNLYFDDLACCNRLPIFRSDTRNACEGVLVWSWPVIPCPVWLVCSYFWKFCVSLPSHVRHATTFTRSCSRSCQKCRLTQCLHQRLKWCIEPLNLIFAVFVCRLCRWTNLNQLG